MHRSVFIVLLSFFVIPAGVFGELAERPGRIGDITAFTGEVFMRDGGEWKKLDKVPHPLHSSDEVVTGRGRAEVKLQEAGTVQIDLDSHVNFVKDASGHPYLINMLVGDIWFDISIRTGETAKFRSPSMTATVKVVSGMFRVSPSGETYHRITGGNMSLFGASRLVPGAAKLRRPYVRAKALPASDPKSSRIQTAAMEAVRAGQKALEAARRAEKEKKFARTAGEAVRVVRTEAVKRQAVDSFAAASVAECDRAVENALAQIMKIRESLLEAEILGDKRAREHIGGLLRQAEEAQMDVKKRAVGIREGALRVKGAADAEALRSRIRPCKEAEVDRALMMASALWVKANAAFVRAEHMRRLGGVAASLAAGDEGLLSVMTDSAAKTEHLASTAGIADENAFAAAEECNEAALREAASALSAIVASVSGSSVLEVPLVAAGEPEEIEAAKELEGIEDGRESPAFKETPPWFKETAPSIDVLMPPPDSQGLPSSSPSS